LSLVNAGVRWSGGQRGDNAEPPPFPAVCERICHDDKPLSYGVQQNAKANLHVLLDSPVADDPRAR